MNVKENFGLELQKQQPFLSQNSHLSGQVKLENVQNDSVVDHARKDIRTLALSLPNAAITDTEYHASEIKNLSRPIGKQVFYRHTKPLGLLFRSQSEFTVTRVNNINEECRSPPYLNFAQYLPCLSTPSDCSSGSTSFASLSASESNNTSESNFRLPISASQLSLPEPPDGGFGWIVVFAAFLVHMITEGVIVSFGIFIEDLVDEFQESMSATSWIGSFSYGIPALVTPVSSVFLNRFGCRITCMVGALMSAIGCLISCFANSLVAMVISFGIFSGFGFSLCMTAALVIVSMYFDDRRATATGLSIAGTGVGALVFAPAVEFLIKIYTWRGTFMLMAAAVLHMAVCGALMRPIETRTERRHRQRLAWLEHFAKESGLPHLTKTTDYLDRDVLGRIKMLRDRLLAPRKASGRAHAVVKMPDEFVKENFFSGQTKSFLVVTSVDNGVVNNKKRCTKLNNVNTDVNELLRNDIEWNKIGNCDEALTQRPKGTGGLPFHSVRNSLLTSIPEDTFPQSFVCTTVEDARFKRLMDCRSIKEQAETCQLKADNLEGSDTPNNLTSFASGDIFTGEPNVRFYNSALELFAKPQKSPGVHPRYSHSTPFLSSITQLDGRIISRRPHNMHSVSFTKQSVKGNILDSIEQRTECVPNTANESKQLTQIKRRKDCLQYTHNFRNEAEVTDNAICPGNQFNAFDRVDVFYRASLLKAFGLTRTTLCRALSLPDLSQVHRIRRGSVGSSSTSSSSESSCVNVSCCYCRKNDESSQEGASSEDTSIASITKCKNNCGISFPVISGRQLRRRLCDCRLFRRFTFNFFLLSNVLLYFWYNVTYFFMGVHAVNLRMTETQAALLFSVLGAANMVGEVVVGLLADREWVDALTLYFFMLLACGVSTVIVPILTSFVTLSSYAGVFGMGLAANDALCTILLVEFVGLHHLTSGLGICFFCQGVANIFGPPTIGFIIDTTHSENLAFLISGIGLILSGFAVIPIIVQRFRRKHARRLRRKQIAANQEPEAKTPAAESAVKL
ncbi:Monocarboxylate transporter 12 [Paragonimus heterotremus]|uniref:Monocarboxylate transporter 12 n=1 Tax=Paragonimus heterotremus TaxID=100268 RepID=A0A8J4TCD7_9TREM|nr:Monocarboxylate transporter 12 [Paragonimus heterotremus]